MLKISAPESEAENLSHYILVKLLRSDKSDGNKCIKSFKWQPSHVLEQGDPYETANGDEQEGEDEEDTSVSVNWEPEYRSLVSRIEKEFGISLTDQGNNVDIVVMSEDGEEPFEDSDSLESVWLQLQAKYEMMEDENERKDEEQGIFVALEVRTGDTSESKQNEDDNSDVMKSDQSAPAQPAAPAAPAQNDENNDELIEMNQTGPAEADDEDDSVSESGRNLLSHVKELENEDDISVGTGSKQVKREKEKVLTPELKLSTIGLKLSQLSEMLNYGSDVADTMEIRESNMVDEIRSLFEAIRECLGRDDTQRREFLQNFPKELADLTGQRGG